LNPPPATITGKEETKPSAGTTAAEIYSYYCFVFAIASATLDMTLPACVDGCLSMKS